MHSTFLMSNIFIRYASARINCIWCLEIVIQGLIINFPRYDESEAQCGGVGRRIWRLLPGGAYTWAGALAACVAVLCLLAAIWAARRHRKRHRSDTGTCSSQASTLARKSGLGGGGGCTEYGAPHRHLAADELLLDPDAS